MVALVLAGCFISDEEIAEREAVLEKVERYAALDDMIRVEPGSFTYGSETDEPGRDRDELDARRVEITYAFEISRIEVTHATWTYTRGGYLDEGSAYTHPKAFGSWAEAVDWTNDVNDGLGLASCYEELSGDDLDFGAAGPFSLCEGYRLPTEAEWEYAARSAGATDGQLPWGQDLASPDTSGECDRDALLSDDTRLSDYAVFCFNSGDELAVADAGVTNALGLHHVGGNAAEWVNDTVSEDRGQAVDPIVLVPGDAHIAKGGDYDDPPSDLRVGARQVDGAEGLHAGIRLVRSLPE